MVYVEFLPWLWVTIIAAAISLIWYYVLKIKLAGGYWFQLIVAWLGAWLGTPVFGDWQFLTPNGICIIPALLAAIGAVMLCRGLHKCLETAFGKKAE